MIIDILPVLPMCYLTCTIHKHKKGEGLVFYSLIVYGDNRLFSCIYEIIELNLGVFK